MAKAHIVTKSGTKVTVEGSPEEVASLIERIEGPEGGKSTNTRSKVPRGSRPTPVGLISELIDGGFFKKPRELGAIRLALQEQGHFYPVTTLSPALLRLVRKKELRRIKDAKRWLYVN
jgi:hypothetical protein